MTEKDLLKILQNYAHYQERLASVEERLRSQQYSLTPSYANTGGGRPSGVNSKVENFAIRQGKLRNEAEGYRRKIAIAENALRSPELTQSERRILYKVITNSSLAAYARAEGMYKSYVYKIRDRALTKAINYIMREM